MDCSTRTVIRTVVEITELSVEFFVVCIRHLDATNGPRGAAPALSKVADLLGQAEQLYKTLPKVKE